MTDYQTEDEARDDFLEEPEPGDGDPGPEEPANDAAIVSFDLGIMQNMADALALLLGDGPLQHADVETHARWLVHLRALRRQLGDVEKDLEDATADRMVGKTVVVEGLGVLSRHERKSRTQWDKDALKSAVLDSRLVDPSTGEVADESPLDKVLACWNLPAPRITALRARGIDADEFCQVEKQAGYSVEIKGA